MIPPSGPSPGQRSSTIPAPKPAYLLAAATIFTSFVTRRSISIMRSSIGAPATSTSALSRPNRVLPPPARIYPPTSVSLFPAVILGLSFSFLFSVHSAFSVVPVLIHILLPAVRAQRGEFPARAISPANSAGAARSSPRFVKRSNDAAPIAGSGRPPRISVWPRGNPVRQYHCPAPRRCVCARWPRRAELRRANPRRRSHHFVKAPRFAPGRSSTRAHCPANRIFLQPPLPRASAARRVLAALRAIAKKLPLATEYLLCARAAAAAQWSPREACRTNPRETSLRESPPANCDAWR